MSPTEEILRATCRGEHPHCFACSEPGEGGLGLRFAVESETGGVVAGWTCPPAGESFPGIVHGGLVATLLDAAMVHALFARGIVARTGELHVRFRSPVCIGAPIVVRAWVQDRHDPLFVLRGDLKQGGSLCAQARGKFMRVPTADEAGDSGGGGT